MQVHPGSDSEGKEMIKKCGPEPSFLFDSLSEEFQLWL